MCIDELTAVMTEMANNMEQEIDFTSDISGNVPKDFTAEDICILKTMFLELEKAIDEIKIMKPEEGDTFPGGYIFELLGKAQLTHGKEIFVTEKLEKIIAYLATTSTSPFARKGNSLQKFCDLLRTAFHGSVNLRSKEKIKQCYKVYIQVEESKKGKKDVWETKKKISKTDGKIISYWCFSPGFSMQQLMEQGVHSIILTSGTLSPLKPFISELGIPIDVQLENPHIVKGEQICVGILSQGPDGSCLNSSFNTRNDPKYIASLGRTILNFSCIIPHGLLIFFPSYSVMKRCTEEWQNIGLWTKLTERKPIYVEPQFKDDFANIMGQYYEKIKDPSLKGAIFMAVCRGKVSEGLDFANANGRAVIITGLPYPPLKDPRIILKQRYLEEVKSQAKEALSGQQWYQLEASRAVNQAIGRVIRHKNDYGAIILCDCRFENQNFKKQLSAWLRPHIKSFSNFGIITKELREFFKYAERALPQPNMGAGQSTSYSLPATSASFDSTISKSSKTALKRSTDMLSLESNFNIDFYTEDCKEVIKPIEEKQKSFAEILATESKPVINFSLCQLKVDHKSTNDLTKCTKEPIAKKRRIRILPVEFNDNLSGPSTSSTITEKTMRDEQKPGESSGSDKQQQGKAYLKQVKHSLSESDYKKFAKMIQDYTKSSDLQQLLNVLQILFPPSKGLLHLFIGFKHFLKKQHIEAFEMHLALLETTELKF